jgi:hypothetical protein
MHQIKPATLFVILLASFFSLQNAAAQKQVPVSINGVNAVSLHRDDKMDTQHALFFKNNPNVLLLHWKRDGRVLEIYLRENVVEQYDLLNEVDVAKAEKLYGKLPSKTGGSYSR